MRKVYMHSRREEARFNEIGMRSHISLSYKKYNRLYGTVDRYMVDVIKEAVKYILRIICAHNKVVK